MSYHITGSLSVVFFLLNIAGILIQLKKIYSRPRLQRTAVISIDQTFTTFLGYFALFVYGYSVGEFNHYLVWPRLPAIPLVMLILWEIARERRTGISRSVFLISLVMFAAGIFGLVSGVHYQLEARLISRILIIFLTLMFVQSYIHQIVRIRRERSVGAVSRGMYILGLGSDIANVVFGFLMGLSEGWPLILDCGTTTILRLILLYQFRWVKGLNRKDPN